MRIRINTSKDMTVGTPWKVITAFAVPVFFSQLFQQLYNTIDSLIVGNYLSTQALAAVSASGPVIFLLISFFAGTSMGAGIVISQHYGAKDMDGVSRAIHTNIVLSVICGIILTLAGVFFTPTLLRWMDTPPNVMSEAVEYFRFYFMGAVAIVLYNSCRGIMNALGDSTNPLVYLIISSVLNVVLDLLFIAVFQWGVWSAAFATTISQLASAILCIIRLSRRDQICPLKLKNMRIDGHMLKEILRLGLPSGIQNSVIAIANVVVQSSINAFGDVAMAAYGSYSKIEGFGFLPITSFNMALTTFTGQNLGAGEYDRAKHGSRFGIIAAVLLAQIIGVLIWLFAPQLIALFDDNPEVVRLGTMQARTVTLFYFLLAFSHAVAAVCRGAGKVFVPMVVMLSVWCVLRIAYIKIIAQIFGEISYIYWAYPITWGISSVIYLFYYLFSDWVHGFDKSRAMGHAHHHHRHTEV